MSPRLPSRPGELLREAFARVHAWARRRTRRVPPLTLAVGCSQIAARRRHDPRAFAHVGHRVGRVCISAAAAKLPVEHVVGLCLHEIGHPLAQRVWGRSEQEDADAAVREFLGVRLSYVGPLLLQHVPTRVARRILNDRHGLAQR
jgi:hypothetical protein